MKLKDEFYNRVMLVLLKKLIMKLNFSGNESLL